MIEIDKIAVGERTKEFAEKRFGKIKDLADAVGMGYNGFHSTYIKGRSLPGAKIIAVYIKLGCNIEWLLFGEGDMKISENTQNSWQLQLENNRLKDEIKVLKEKLYNIEQTLKK